MHLKILFKKKKKKNTILLETCVIWIWIYSIPFSTYPFVVFFLVARVRATHEFWGVREGELKGKKEKKNVD